MSTDIFKVFPILANIEMIIKSLKMYKLRQFYKLDIGSVSVCIGYIG